MQETCDMQVQSLGQEDPLAKGMATHFSILAWRTPWTEKSMGLQSWTRLKQLSMHSGNRKRESKNNSRNCYVLCVYTLTFTKEALGICPTS